MLIEILKTELSTLRCAFRSRAALLAENVVLRQQIIALQCSVPKPRIRARDRVVFALAARVFVSVLKAIIIVRRSAGIVPFGACFGGKSSTSA